ncbi:hypothetical protein MNBD_GAMMA09-1105 [hydrothermal vent metagenome]|uniref:Uncharacterized protein n=1 Tax=hydrothermal vent metagenome TaxID=652676 RepID=A0A3B0XKX9_9ZZZZ
MVDSITRFWGQFSKKSKSYCINPQRNNRDSHANKLEKCYINQKISGVVRSGSNSVNPYRA